MKNKRYTRGLIVLSFICLASCSPIAKLVLGIKKFKTYIPNKERVEYYKPFFETQKNRISIYTFKDWNGIQTTFDSLHVPRIYVENTVTDSVYVLSCYEDISADVKDINNNNNLRLITVADKKEFSDFKKIIDTSAILTYTENEIRKNEKWKVYLINGIFMGKKLRKRTLPVSTINSLQEIIVLDTSINEESTENKDG